MLDFSIRQRLGAFTLDVSLQTAERGITALFGPSGSGKTSIINAISGLTSPDSGHIRVDDVVFFDRTRRIDLAAEKRRVGYVFQEARLFPHMTVRDNLLYGYRRVERADRPIAPDPVIGLLGLGHLLDRRPGKLSGGEKQRVALGRALLAQPRVLLLDEPLAALDSARKAEILPYIERLRDEMHIPMVLVSHAIEEVVRLASSVALIAEGRIRAFGGVREVLGRLDLAAATGFHEAGAVIDARVESHDEADGLSVVTFDSGRLVIPRLLRPLGAPVRLRIHARDVILATTPPTGLSVQNALAGTVVEVAENAESSVDLKVALGGSAIIARITRRAFHQLGLVPGTAVYALVKGASFEPERDPQGTGVVDL